MRLSRISFFALAFVFVLGACAGNPGPGESGYAYNLTGTYSGSLDVEGMLFSSVLELNTAPGGAVTGTFTATGMSPVSGEITGTITEDTFVFRIRYNRTAEGCSGVLSGRATIPTGGGEFTSSVGIDDNCDGSLAGFLRVSR
jgi:hypothetical protein